MSATPQQIQSAKAIAKQRGYDPNLVDSDNADRVDSAFPVKSGGGAAPKPAMATQATPAAAPSPMPTSTPTGIPAPGGTPGGAKVADPMAATPTTPSMTGLDAAMGGGGGSPIDNLMQSGLGSLRPLGQRMPPNDGLLLNRRAY